MRKHLLNLQPVDQRYTSLGDGRRVCSECLESAVMATKDCQPLYRDILKFYRNVLGMPIEQEVPMLLVEREALNNAREVEKDVSFSFHSKIWCTLSFAFVHIKVSRVLIVYPSQICTSVHLDFPCDLFTVSLDLMLLCDVNAGTHSRSRNSRSVFVGRANPSCKIIGPPLQEISYIFLCMK